MKKHLRFILILIAVLFFIVAFLVDTTSFGRHWDKIWEVDAKRMLLTPLIITVTGFILGLFFFRKQPYVQRLLYTVPISVILFSILLIGNAFTFEYGLFESYNYFTAKRDIKHGKIQILTAGHSIEPMTEDEQRAEDLLRNALGYTIIDIGIWSPGAEKYNHVMEAYLEERNGKDWRNRLNKRNDSAPQELHLQN